jgi:hypothetical protein
MTKERKPRRPRKPRARKAPPDAAAGEPAPRDPHAIAGWIAWGEAVEGKRI